LSSYHFYLPLMPMLMDLKKNNIENDLFKNI
jgi:hypothetical protein